jgi:hypothetical protein
MCHFQDVPPIGPECALQIGGREVCAETNQLPTPSLAFVTPTQVCICVLKTDLCRYVCLCIQNHCTVSPSPAARMFMCARVLCFCNECLNTEQQIINIRAT